MLAAVVTKRKTGFTLVVCLFLAACAGQARKPASPESMRIYEQRFESLSAVTDWTLEGRLAATNGKDGGSGSLRWQQSEVDTRMSFRGALGKGAWELDATENQAHLQFADGRSYSAPSITQLVIAHMDSKVPVDALVWWVRGLARPDGWQAMQLDEEGRITSLSQLGWDVTFSGYKDQGNFWLPGKLVARNQDHSVKLAVSQWSFGQQAE